MDIRYIFQNAKMLSSNINEHLDKLYQESLNHDTICEFGTCTGISTIAFLNAIFEAKERGCHKKVTTYDFIFKDQARNLDFLAVKNGIDNNFSIVIEDVLEIPPVQCDLLFIDTLHNYDQIKQELSVHVENNPNPPKTIIFHDVESFAFIEEQPYGENGGILPAILEFLSRNHQWYVDYYVRNCNGLMIIKRHIDKCDNSQYNDDAYNFAKQQIKKEELVIEYKTPDQKIENLNACAEKIRHALQSADPTSIYKVHPSFVFGRFSISNTKTENHFKVYKNDKFVEYIEI